MNLTHDSPMFSSEAIDKRISRMRIKKLLRAIVPTFERVPAKRSEEGKEVARNLVKTYARGNVNLQRGRYLTKSQMLVRKQNLAKHSF